ncbi:(2Fe-2S)-binding protein [Kitasatospora sp. NPDC057015]|uniref:(2Fe-2S)-binding protein n=1 Tax=Kitasatospora sp. NPDC057015 TaxID=3346001 RepID=UPI0036386EA8
MTASSIGPCPPPTVRPAPAFRPARDAPCVRTHARLREASPAVRVHHGPPRSGDGWVSGAELLRDPAALRELIAFDARDGLERYGAALRPDVAAGFCLHRYCWPVGLLFTWPWLLERRVPSLPAEALSLRRRTGELTVELGAFACLPDDPAAGLPGAEVVADPAALRARLLAALAEHLTPLLAVFRPELRRGPRTLWACATDAVVEGLWQVSALLGEEERAVDALGALLPGHAGARTAPFVGGAGFRLEERAGAPPVRTRTRAGCCLLYTVRPEDACTGCPRVTRG